MIGSLLGAGGGDIVIGKTQRRKGDANEFC
jgi:hypothetical protein